MALINITKKDENKPTRYYSKKQEEKVAKVVGGNRTLNSGATPFYKGDVVTDEWLLECKTKTKPSESISIKKEWIEKNVRESLFMNKKYSSIVFSFGENQPNYYIIDEYLFLELQEYLRNKKDE